MRLSADITFDYNGYPDYWQGHGHAFAPDNLKACLRFTVPISYRETVKDIVNSVIADINGSAEPFDFLTEDKQEQKEIEDWLSDEHLEETIRSSLKSGAKDEDDFFEDKSKAPEENEEEDEEFESPVLIGWIHIYEEKEAQTSCQ